MTNLIPNIRLLETHLNNFCRMCDADEVVLFERATFLVISHAQYASGESNSNTNGDTAGIANYTPLNNTGTAILPDGSAAASSPPTDAVDIPASSMASSPMSPDDSNSGMMGGETAPESTGGDAGGEKASKSGSADRQGGAIEETPRHVGRTPHFDSHRFEKVRFISGGCILLLNY